MIRRYIIWRNNHAYDERPRRVVDRANQPDAALALSWCFCAHQAALRYSLIRP
jgi:hypothetical protein